MTGREKGILPGGFSLEKARKRKMCVGKSTKSGRGVCMEERQDISKTRGFNLEKIEEELLDVLSLVILLENDMEMQKSDSIHLRIVKMVHNRIKGIQKNLSEDSGQTE